MVNWIPIVSAILGAAPAAAIFFTAYGRYDGAFNDRTVFLYFIGGMLFGGIVGFFALLLLNTTQALIAVIGLSLLIPIALVAAVNRRKWQGERHAIFNGGAAGLGMAIMLSFSFLYFRGNSPYITELAPLMDVWEAANKSTRGPAPTIPTAPFVFNAEFVGQGILLAIGLAGIFFGLGLLAGNGVRLRKQFRMAFLGTAIVFAPVVFLEEFNRSSTWLWVVLLAAYGAIFAYAAERKVLLEGVSEEARKARRRRKRKAALEP